VACISAASISGIVSVLLVEGIVSVLLVEQAVIFDSGRGYAAADLAANRS